MRQWSRATLAAWLRDGSPGPARLSSLLPERRNRATSQPCRLPARGASTLHALGLHRPRVGGIWSDGEALRVHLRGQGRSGCGGTCAARSGTASSGTGSSSRRTARPSDLFAAAALSVSASLTGPADSRATVAIADMAHLNGIDLDNHAYGANCYLKGKLCAQTLCVLSR